MNLFDPLADWLAGVLERLGERRPIVFWLVLGAIIVGGSLALSALWVLMLTGY